MFAGTARLRHLASFGFCALLSAGAFAQIATPVALTGDPVPGGGGGTFSEFFTAVINNSGRVAFTGTFTGANSGIWSEGFGTLALVVQGGATAPGTSAAFDSFAGSFPIVLSDSGRVAFRHALSGTGVDSSNSSGLWSENPSAILQLIARAGSPAAGFGSFNYGPLDGNAAINAGGNMAFTTSLVGAMRPEGNGVWVGSAANLFLTRSGQPPFSTSVYSFDLNARMNDGGVFATIAGLENPERRAIVTGSQGVIGIVVVGSAFQGVGQQAPGTPEGTTFSALSPVFSFNTTSRVAFSANLVPSETPPVTAANNVGIWSDVTGQLTLYARAGDQAPDLPAGVVFNSASDSLGFPALGNGGHIVWKAGLLGPGVDGSNNEGIWLNPTGGGLPTKLIARTGNQVPGQPAGVTYGQLLGYPAVNFAGQVAFIASLSTGAQGVFVTDNSGNARLIVKTGDTIQLAGRPGTFTIAGPPNRFGFDHGRGNQGGFGGGGEGYGRVLNDSGQVVVHATFGAPQFGRGVLVFNAPGASPRGDSNGDGIVSSSDVIHLVNFLFGGGTAPTGSGDANSDTFVTILDVFFLINYLFAGGPAPAA